MTTDEELIQRIAGAMRDEVAGIQPPADLLGRVRPPRGAREPLAPADRRRTWRPSFGGLVAGAAGVIAVAVLVVAVSSLGHNRAPIGRPARVPAAARGLVSRLAVLRRPQRRSDRLPAWAAKQVLGLPDYERLVPGLSRLVATVRGVRLGTARVYLIVMTPAHYPHRVSGYSGPLLSPRLGDQAATVVIAGRFVSAATLGEPAALLSTAGMENTRTGIAQGGPGDVRRTAEVAASIVPDGVARVRWTWSGWPNEPKNPSTTMDVRAIDDNVAVDRLTSAVGLLATATWYSADGRKVAAFSDNAGIARQEQAEGRALGQSARQVTAPALLAEFSVLRDPPPAPARITSVRLAALGGSPRMGLNYKRVRFVPYPGAPTLPGEPRGLWVVPGSHGIALLTDGLNFGESCNLGWRSCRPDDLQLVGSDASANGTTTIEGLVPDGNATVAVLMADGTRHTALVIDNVFSITVPEGATYLIDRSAAGREVRTRLGG